MFSLCAIKCFGLAGFPFFSAFLVVGIKESVEETVVVNEDFLIDACTVDIVVVLFAATCSHGLYAMRGYKDSRTAEH